MIDWRPFSPKALDFISNSTARLCILDGSVRSSKTVNCTVRWLSFCKDGPPGDLVMLGKTAATLQRNVLNDIFDIVGPKAYKWTNKQQGELILLGRRVYCFGANNEEAEGKIRGATFAGAYCDEVSLYPQSVFMQLMARMSVRGAQCFCNTNPDSPYHWFYTDFILNDTITNKQRWRFTMDDNLSLDPDYVADLKSMYTGVWYRRFILGEWVVAEGAVYDMFNPELHVSSSYKQFKQLYTYYVACDYATSSVMTFGLYRKYVTGVRIKEKEFYYDAVKEGTQLTDSQFADKFQGWLGGVNPRRVYVDPSAASWKAELLWRGYNVADAVNEVVNGIRKVSSELNRGMYLMDPSCTNSIQEYSSYAWDPVAQLRGEDKPIKKNDHTCDCDRYFIYTDSLYELSGVYPRGGK